MNTVFFGTIVSANFSKTGIVKLQKISIAVDNTPQSMEVAKAGMQFAQKLNAEVAFVKVVEIIVNIGAMEGVPLSAEADMIEAGRQEAEQVFRHIATDLCLEKKTSYFAPEGIPKTEILSIADEWSADLIVVGTHGRTGLSHLFLGSVAEYVVRHSKVPVIVVPVKT